VKHCHCWPDCTALHSHCRHGCRSPHKGTCLHQGCYCHCSAWTDSSLSLLDMCHGQLRVSCGASHACVISARYISPGGVAEKCIVTYPLTTTSRCIRLAIYCCLTSYHNLQNLCVLQVIEPCACLLCSSCSRLWTTVLALLAIFWTHHALHNIALQLVVIASLLPSQQYLLRPGWTACCCFTHCK
jgi:hypothetical protein